MLKILGKLRGYRRFCWCFMGQPWKGLMPRCTYGHMQNLAAQAVEKPGTFSPVQMFLNEVLWGPRSPGPGVWRKQTRQNSALPLFFQQDISSFINSYIKILWTSSPMGTIPIAYPPSEPAFLSLKPPKTSPLLA